ncbi:hypothetical protein GDO78_007631 [Eleutherodactylus coqui]|uniref:Uncharacterized protein n=1 Tax=Eleutherodactylus coqui TaxID=57060 RepID=A0A8J6FHU7_ELECQ|nr:hypothetical protein GDO78_007631 [Eleutherodactylus coqui]
MNTSKQECGVESAGLIYFFFFQRTHHCPFQWPRDWIVIALPSQESSMPFTTTKTREYHLGINLLYISFFPGGWATLMYSPAGDSFSTQMYSIWSVQKNYRICDCPQAIAVHFCNESQVLRGRNPLAESDPNVCRRRK